MIMTRLFVLTVCVLISFLLVAAVNAGPTDNSETQSFESLVQSGQINRPKAGISWREQVMRERAIMYRASDKRNALQRKALRGEQEQMEGATVGSYNAQILENNAKMAK